MFQKLKVFAVCLNANGILKAMDKKTKCAQPHAIYEAKKKRCEAQKPITITINLMSEGAYF